MKRSEIEKWLIESIREVQQIGGHPSVAIDLRTCPLKELEGFDSLTGVETTALLGMKLGYEIPCGKHDVNLFVSEDSCRALRLGEVVDRIVKVVKEH